MSARHLDPHAGAPGGAAAARAIPERVSAAAADLRFVTQGLSPEEVAAATAVLTAALHEQALAADARVERAPRSAWTDGSRVNLMPRRGAWRGFAG